MNTKQNSNFDIGEVVVYPKHGVGEIVKVETMEIASIKTKFYRKDFSPTIIKTRFIDSNSKHKMLGVYDINSEPISKSLSSRIENYLKKELSKFDMILTYDYGHGFLNSKIASILSSKSNLLALNAQVNSSSVGSHSIEKYKKSSSKEISIV